jgi:hypothetical protein
MYRLPDGKKTGLVEFSLVTLAKVVTPAQVSGQNLGSVTYVPTRNRDRPCLALEVFHTMKFLLRE